MSACGARVHVLLCIHSIERGSGSERGGNWEHGDRKFHSELVHNEDVQLLHCGIKSLKD